MEIPNLPRLPCDAFYKIVNIMEIVCWMLLILRAVLAVIIETKILQ